jgi:hypothetical protein
MVGLLYRWLGVPVAPQNLDFTTAVLEERHHHDQLPSQ